MSVPIVYPPKEIKPPFLPLEGENPGNRLIVSLFDYTGIWSQPYRDAGYQVEQIDIQHGRDLFRETCPNNIHGLIMQPPCTDFTLAGAKWFAEKDANGTTEVSIKLVRTALKWVDVGIPKWWVLENPMSRIHKLIPELGKVKLNFSPWEYGEDYSKTTWLWGVFNNPVKMDGAVYPGAAQAPGSWYNKVGGKSIETKNFRSKTSAKFAQAFFLANP